MQIALLLCLLLTLSEPVAQRRARPTPTATPTPIALTETDTTWTWGWLAFFGVLTIVQIFLYFIPTIVGWNKQNFVAILALNFFLGWTIVGWVVALVWALTVDRPTRS